MGPGQKFRPWLGFVNFLFLGLGQPSLVWVWVWKISPKNPKFSILFALYQKNLIVSG